MCLYVCIHVQGTKRNGAHGTQYAHTVASQWYIIGERQ